jgi:hypothetical protein
VTEPVFNCAVCGKPVDPAVDIAMGVAKTPLFVVHAEGCRDTVRTGVRVARDMLEARYPLLRAFRKAFSE